MGYADRDYQLPFRVEDEHPEVEGRYARWIYLLAALVAAGVIAPAVLPDGRLPAFRGMFALDAGRVLSRPWQIVTYPFLHEDLGTAFLDLVLLVAFGRAVEGRLGARRFFAIFFAGTIASGLAFLAVRMAVPGPAPFFFMRSTGGVLAVLAAFAAIFPWAEVPFVLYRLPSWLFAAAAIAIYSAFCLKSPSGGFEQAAHLTGAVAGWVGVQAFSGAWPRGRRVRPAFSPRSVGGEEAGSRLAAAPPGKPEPLRAAPSPAVGAEVDRILDKISAGGIASLTVEEKHYLDEASRRYRK